MREIVLRKSDEMRSVVEPALAQLASRLNQILPGVKVEHIGATAIPGALTKGDLDVALRVPARQFGEAVEVLKKSFSIKQHENWTPEFASFGDDSGYPMPVGVQISVEDSKSDFLVFLRDYLIANPSALVEYNDLKRQSFRLGWTSYWQAKDRFLARVLSSRTK